MYQSPFKLVLIHHVLYSLQDFLTYKSISHLCLFLFYFNFWVEIWKKIVFLLSTGFSASYHRTCILPSPYTRLQTPYSLLRARKLLFLLRTDVT